MATPVVAPTRFTIAYDQEVPQRAPRAQVARSPRRPSIYAEPCAKIMMGEATNARMSFVSPRVAKCAASTCDNFIRRRGLPLKPKVHGRDMYIVRRDTTAAQPATEAN